MTLQQLRQVIAVADYGSMNEAAKQLYLTQPSLSATIKAVEREIGIEIFTRSNRGIIATPEGEEFLGYARQVSEQYQLMEDKYLSGGPQKKKFSVSMQHYTFAVEAFIRLLRQYEENNVYEFSVFEGRTIDVIENRKDFTRGRLGICTPLFLQNICFHGEVQSFGKEKAHFHGGFDGLSLLHL